MKRRLQLLVVMFAVFSLPMSAVAAEQEMGAMKHQHEMMEGTEHESMEHQMEGMEGMEHEGMMVHGAMIILGNATDKGVVAMAHIQDVRDVMAQMGMDSTHHFMVVFVDEVTGEEIEAGTVAIKIVDPYGKVSEPIELMAMQGHFGADVSLKTQGRYKIKVGTKLSDGEKRQFEFSYSLK